jgi:membrane protease YdiL (CAAX protease family)
MNESRKLTIFLAATFAWTWAFYAPLVVTGHSPYQMPWMILLILGGAGPSIVGVALVLLTYSPEERRDYWQRCFSLRRIRLLWWLVILLIFPALFGLSIVLDRAAGGPVPGMVQLRDLLANPAMWPLAALISFMSGPWSEEFGWRGVALDPLIRRFGLWTGTVLLGIVWAAWHLPLYFMPDTWHGQMGFKPAGFWLFVAYSVALSLIMTWIFVRTNRSILSGMLLHFTSNFTAQLLAPSSDGVEFWRAVLTLVVGAAGCVWLNRPAQKQERQ